MIVRSLRFTSLNCIQKSYSTATMALGSGGEATRSAGPESPDGTLAKRQRVPTAEETAVDEAAATALASPLLESASIPSVPSSLPDSSHIDAAWAYFRKLGSPRYHVAPMVDQSELPFRLLCRKYGAEAAYTPMLHSRLFAENVKYRTEFTTCPEDRPLFVQFCANNPETLLAAAQLVAPVCDYVDINLGCPQRIARRGNYGAFLMDNLPLVRSLVASLAANLAVPVSCKIRMFPSLDDTLAYARMLEGAGCSLLGVHGRTRDQKNGRAIRADWQVIRAVKQAVRIPVIANGNVRWREDADECMRVTGADGVMSAESLLGNPALFAGHRMPGECDEQDGGGDVEQARPAEEEGGRAAGGHARGGRAGQQGDHGLGGGDSRRCGDGGAAAAAAAHSVAPGAPGASNGPSAGALKEEALGGAAALVAERAAEVAQAPLEGRGQEQEQGERQGQEQGQGQVATAEGSRASEVAGEPCAGEGGGRGQEEGAATAPVVDQIMLILEYLELCERYPVPLRMIRAHVHRQLGPWFRVHPDLRERLNKEPKISPAWLKGLVREMAQRNAANPALKPLPDTGHRLQQHIATTAAPAPAAAAAGGAAVTAAAAGSGELASPQGPAAGGTGQKGDGDREEKRAPASRRQEELCA
eukprot:jgi/Mesen1/4601/ME000232S03855